MTEYVYVFTDIDGCLKVTNEGKPNCPRIDCYEKKDIDDNMFHARMERKEYPWAVLVMEPELYQSYFGKVK